MMINCLVLCSLTLLSTLIRVMLLNCRTSSKNMAMGRLLYLVDTVFVVTIILMPLNFGTVVMDSLLMGLYSSLASMMTGFFENIRNLESELESKARDIDTAEAKMISERKQSQELVRERDRLLESSGTRLKLLESVLETKRRDVAVAEANATTLKKQLEELLLEHDVILERNQSLRDESESLKTTVEQLEFELETRTGDVGVAEANATALKKLFDEFILDYDVLRERNQSIRNQSESLNTRVIILESELETRMKEVGVSEANNMTLRKQFEDSLLQNERLSQSNQVLNNQLQSSNTRLQKLESEFETKRNEASNAEAKVVALRKEKQDLDFQLQSSRTSLRRKEHELKTETKNVTSAKAENLELRRQLGDLQFKLDSMNTKSKEASLWNENQNLKNQLQLSSTKLRRLESAIAIANSPSDEIESLKDRLQSSETKLKQARSAEATLRKENESLKRQLKILETKLEQVESALRKENQSSKQSSATKSVNDAKAGNSAAEKFGRFLFDQF